MTRRLTALLPTIFALGLGCAPDGSDAPYPSGSPHEPLDDTAPPPKEKPKSSATPPVVEDPKPSDPKPEETSPQTPPAGQQGSTAAPALTFADAATKARAAELAGKLEGGSFSYKLRTVADALAFLHLAHTSEDSVVTAAALDAIATVYWGRNSDKYRKIDSNYNAVVAYRLASEHPAVKTAALAAAGRSMDAEPTDPTLTELLLGQATEDNPPATRVMALKALAGAKPFTGPIQAVFIKAFDAKSDAIVALALEAITHYASRFSEREALVAKLTALTKSDHPGVRGKALAALCNVSHEEAHRERTAKLALEMLADDNAYVRGEAVYAIGQLRRLGLAGEIIKKLDDDADAAFAIDGWTKLDGSADRERLVAPGGRSVTAAALLSLSLLSTATDNKFEYVKDIVREGPGKEDYGPAVKKAKAWYAKNKSKLGKK